MAETGDEVVVTEVVACEAWSGAKSANDRALTATASLRRVRQSGLEQAKPAGHWRADARAAGRTLSLADALIAATADALGAAVLTRNVGDFALTPVRVETY